MSIQEKGNNLNGDPGRVSEVRNPDRNPLSERPFILRPESTPTHLHRLFQDYTFRRCTLDEILDSEDLTQDAWPGVIPTNKHDLTMRDLINAPMCGAFTNHGKMVGYTRLLWGYDNLGKAEIHSHMTAVSSSLQDGGIGELLKWQARQVALEFPNLPVDQQSVTFDNMQGRIAYINLNKLGMICGAAGGVFKHDVYKELYGEQHRGNPTDRYQARWYLNSDWTLAHLEERVSLLPDEEVQQLPSTIQYETIEIFNKSLQAVLQVPRKVNMQLDQLYITLPTPLNWDEFLRKDTTDNKLYANSWKRAHRTVLDTYHANGYTTIFQASYRDLGVNLQVLAKNFNPFRPPAELLKF